MLRQALYCVRFSFDPYAVQINEATGMVRTANPEYANMFNEAGPLSYYALSSILVAFFYSALELTLI